MLGKALAVHLLSRASSETTRSEKENENEPPRHYQLSLVYNFVKLAELYYAGSHGMDIKGPAKGPRYTKAKVGSLLLFGHLEIRTSTDLLVSDTLMAISRNESFSELG
ncbi:hypothetical protein J5N97_008993 [Dioscorea zingiberensis]|uniref:Uncharacterized protein n=1 Tax=Dioscorea zingiberensis TaxID=325984 RepID=A0A9D5CYH3_9LILI|nr:hypothetical protein J5N97_008993 [Dioscorea zingiberensis]